MTGERLVDVMRARTLQGRLVTPRLDARGSKYSQVLGKGLDCFAVHRTDPWLVALVGNMVLQATIICRLYHLLLLPHLSTHTLGRLFDFIMSIMNWYRINHMVTLGLSGSYLWERTYTH